jgi:hypothetical protein
MLAELSNVARMLFARPETIKSPANVQLDTQEMLELHVIQVSLFLKLTNYFEQFLNKQ